MRTFGRLLTRNIYNKNKGVERQGTRTRSGKCSNFGRGIPYERTTYSITYHEALYILPVEVKTNRRNPDEDALVTRCATRRFFPKAAQLHTPSE